MYHKCARVLSPTICLDIDVGERDNLVIGCQTPDRFPTGAAGDLFSLLDPLSVLTLISVIGGSCL